MSITSDESNTRDSTNGKDVFFNSSWCLKRDFPSAAVWTVEDEAFGAHLIWKLNISLLKPRHLRQRNTVYTCARVGVYLSYLSGLSFKVDVLPRRNLPLISMEVGREKLEREVGTCRYKGLQRRREKGEVSGEGQTSRKKGRKGDRRKINTDTTEM